MTVVSVVGHCNDDANMRTFFHPAIPVDSLEKKKTFFLFATFQREHPAVEKIKPKREIVLNKIRVRCVKM